MSSNENIAPLVMKRLMKEIQELVKSPPDGITVTTPEDDFSSITATIDGPVGTPYEGGKFTLRMSFDGDFPSAPPKSFFLTKLFHPNISTKGEICVNTLKKDWQPDLGIKHVLVVIRCLIIEPNPESALNEEAGKLLLEDYEAFAKHARLMTQVHALASASGPNVDASKDAVADKLKSATTAGSAVGAKDAPAKRKSLKRL
jgi:ubiquitin-conjugating enzyme E2 S